MTDAESIFVGAREIREPGARAAYLTGACRANPGLRERVEAMLQEAERADEFFGADPDTVISQSVVEEAGTSVGRYKLLEKIGSGGMGAVYMAEQREPVVRKVALKIIKLGMDTKQVVARFEAERQALALMEHPNIAKVLDGGATETGRPYFVMELVQGLPITRFCDEAQLNTKDRLELFLDVCSAIQHAHQKGIIHRDVKPSNILVTLIADKPVPKVIDFGIAKATQQRLTEKTLFTQFQHFLGTPAYMSPEQASLSGQDVDTRSDVYSLGVLLYELLTGKTPFDSGDLARVGLDEMRRTIREKEPARPSTRLSTLAREDLSTTASRRRAAAPELIQLLRGDLDWIVMKCLEKDRTRRYETVNGLAADVRRFLQNEPVLARPPSQVYRFQKFVRRNPGLIGSLAAVGVALLAGTIVSARQASRAIHAEKAARAEADRATRAEQDARKKGEAAESERARAESEKAAANRHAYSALMLLAGKDWESGNVEHLRRILEETQSYSDRSFEWFYWQAMCHQELLTFSEHVQAVYSIGVSPDNRTVASAGADQVVRLWDLETGRELKRLTGHRGAVRSVVFSPDGKRILTASQDRTVRLWDAATEREMRVFLGNVGAVSSASFSSDGTRVASGGDDRTVRIWDVASGGEQLTIADLPSAVTAVAFSPDGDRIIAATQDGYLRSWARRDGQPWRDWKAHEGALLAVCFSPDGSRAITYGQDGNVRTWDTSNRGLLASLAGNSLSALTLSPSLDEIYVGRWNNSIECLPSKAELPRLTWRGNSHGITSLAVTPDRHRLISGSDNGTIKVWPTGAVQELRRLSDRAGAELSSLSWSPDGRRLLTLGPGLSIRVWDAATGHALRTVAKPDPLGLRGVAFSPDGQRIVSCGISGLVKVWSAESGEEQMTLKGHQDQASVAGFTHDGRKIVSGGEDGTIFVWDVSTGKLEAKFRSEGNVILSEAITPNGRRLVIGTITGRVELWDLEMGRPLFSRPVHHAGVSSVRLSPDDRWIASGSWDGSVCLLDAATGETLRTVGSSNGGVSSVQFSPDGRRILIARDQVSLCEVDAGRELITLPGLTTDVSSAAFSPDGLTIAAAEGESICVWSQASPGAVRAWAEEAKLVQERLVKKRLEQERQSEQQRRERLIDPGLIKKWLVLAPIPMSTEDFARAMRTEQLPSESSLQVGVGQAAFVGKDKLVWREVDAPSGVLDLTRLIGSHYPFGLCYAVAYLTVPAEEPDLLLKVGSDDTARVFVNGRLVYEELKGRPLVPDEDVVGPITLHAGVNHLVVKVGNVVGGWQASVRFCRRDGSSIQGLQVSLQPP